MGLEHRVSVEHDGPGFRPTVDCGLGRPRETRQRWSICHADEQFPVPGVSDDRAVDGTGTCVSLFLWPMRIRGRNRQDLRRHWGDDPRAYLGIVVPGYLNLFMSLRTQHQRRHHRKHHLLLGVRHALRHGAVSGCCSKTDTAAWSAARRSTTPTTWSSTRTICRWPGAHRTRAAGTKAGRDALRRTGHSSFSNTGIAPGHQMPMMIVSFFTPGHKCTALRRAHVSRGVMECRWCELCCVPSVVETDPRTNR